MNLLELTGLPNLLDLPDLPDLSIQTYFKIIAISGVSKCLILFLLNLKKHNSSIDFLTTLLLCKKSQVLDCERKFFAYKLLIRVLKSCNRNWLVAIIILYLIISTTYFRIIYYWQIDESMIVTSITSLAPVCHFYKLHLSGGSEQTPSEV